LSSWRRHAEAVRDAELKRAMRRLESLSPEQQYVVEALSRSLVNKLLHGPTLRAKHAASMGDGQRYADMLRDLWGF
jgi:glutamyl-tRNA reductase